MMQFVKDTGYTTHVGINYEGISLPEPEVINASQILLQRLGSQLS